METAREFLPESLSRRGEAITWGLALICVVGLIYLQTQAASVSIWQFAFVFLMLLTAAGTSLGNWMDRKTLLTLAPGGIHFRNGLRDVSLKWDEIQAMQVFPSRWGDQVHVIGKDAHFNFRTLSEFTLKGKTRGKMGFTDGAFIIQEILSNSDLAETPHPEKGRYYARP